MKDFDDLNPGNKSGERIIIFFLLIYNDSIIDHCFCFIHKWNYLATFLKTGVYETGGTKRIIRLQDNGVINEL